MNRNIKGRMARPPGSQGAELENQFILRLPAGSLQAQAASLREAIRHGHTNIKDRLAIQLDFTNDKDDMRNGVITIDTIMYKARLMDYPTIMETWKSIDGKNFYKTADVCQMLMVREEEDPPEEEDSKKKRRDPNKVDKKYLWPHGYTPPLKNVRKRRFRKTLRKKNLDLPEIEKEVKRLLRTDNEATSIRWEVIREEDEKKNNADTNISSSNLDEQLFGGALSSSDDEVGPTINIMDEDDDSRLSVDDSRFSESYLQNEAGNSPPCKPGGSGSGVPQVTDFSGMFQKEGDGASSKPQMPSPSKASKGKSGRSSSKKGSSSGGGHGRSSEDGGHSSDSTSKLYARISMLENELTLLTQQRAAQEAEIANIENLALKQRFLSKLADIETHIREKEDEIEEIRHQLQE
ncbi:transcription initiation factor TFIID subunit 7-like isoform X1 [Eriocheir sinensis]|uniref:transcription initiation factor TFIID subunit 7-like isoform X1 n=1 Tax=Eriocheir sinensis TaxID=95602 RepID=UPI0021C87CA9|nr:transcription initiation factor TFIID subunit 7-like isoform X1 [Eriocheir sinensis]XP_050719282.1 transcription initiation factor TFIID subunit 7-like isoform X1 [Eriocheir sinensis]XP_050719283.1 transcription initiation factor TFIID subunit 7-like isoform X1 [Eriocheir sinensis]XP_050719284.1 transcription initiation factor TFIID subunit 7-like isoform X1 [Eriocheir sinensis]